MEGLFHIIPILALIGYSCATVDYLRVYGGSHSLRRGRACLWVGLVAQVIFLVLELLGSYRTEPVDFIGVDFVGVDFVSRSRFPISLSLVGIVVVGAFLLFERRFRFSSLGGIIAPIGLFLFVLASFVFHIGREVSQAQDKVSVLSETLLYFHIGGTLLANVCLVLSFAVSVAVILHEVLLKRRQLTFIQRKLPSLFQLERINGYLVNSGFLLMVLGIGVGFLFALVSGMHISLLDARLQWSAATLVVYSLLMFARSRGWRGRRVAWLGVAGFVMLIASSLTVNYWANTFHLY